MKIMNAWKSLIRQLATTDYAGNFGLDEPLFQVAHNIIAAKDAPLLYRITAFHMIGIIMGLDEIYENRVYYPPEVLDIYLEECGYDLEPQALHF